MSRDWQKIPLDAGVLARVIAAMAAVVVSVVAIQHWVDSRIDERALVPVERNAKTIDRAKDELRALRQRVRQLEIRQRGNFYDSPDQSVLLRPYGDFWYANGWRFDAADGRAAMD